MDPLVLKAPAKINWSLFVLGKRPDGYHNILSLMQTVSLSDTIEIHPSERIEVITEMDIPVEQNLVYRAAILLRDHAECRSGARIILKKEIPAGAGLGGGSSDAATALMGLNLFWRLGLSRETLKKVGEQIGSDVPFFFHSPIAMAEGRGEILTPF
ncbi:MAG: 4-(cytidine 5'-diphospho)-2-C-methyl-D-erythritol kinase, partial [Nitrospirales bacterium]|nr:4-(cytidine 5'-diphospho)-2-C-methyl-D-erythritol kinase [Nitrospirales bacterium]